MKKQILNANLIKKYHQDLVFNYSEYPTKDHWDFGFKNDEYKKAILDWFPKNKDKKIFFYVHIPFCEELCWFCTCSKFINKDYEKVTDYLNYLYKEIDLLFEHLAGIDSKERLLTKTHSGMQTGISANLTNEAERFSCPKQMIN